MQKLLNSTRVNLGLLSIEVGQAHGTLAETILVYLTEYNNLLLTINISHRYISDSTGTYSLTLQELAQALGRINAPIGLTLSSNNMSIGYSGIFINTDLNDYVEVTGNRGETIRLSNGALSTPIKDIVNQLMLQL